MARITKPFLSIDGTEFQCFADSLSLGPDGIRNFCEDEWSMSVDIELTYGTGESHTVLDAMRDTVVEVVVRPSDAAIGVGNPSATFDARIPAIPFMEGATRGDRMRFTLELMAEDTPAYATA